MGGSKTLSLRLIVIMLIGISMIIFISLFFFIFYNTMPKMLLQSEDRYLEKQLDVVEGLLESSFHTMHKMAADVGIWEEPVKFVEGKNPDFIKNNWPDHSILDNYGFDFIIIKDIKGKDLYIEFSDYMTDKKIMLLSDLSSAINRISEAVLKIYDNFQIDNTAVEQLGKGGILFYKGVPYGIVTMPIMESRMSGNPVGTVTLGSIMDNQYFRELTHYETISFELISSPALTIIELPRIAREQKNIISTSMPLKDIIGNPIILRMSDNRIIYTEGQNILDRTSLMLVLSVSFFILILYFIVVNLILHPIEKLSKDISNIASDSKVDIKKYSNNKEFKTLAFSINEMLDKVKQSNISINVFKSILNGMDAYIYVSDPENDEILFINDKMAAHFNANNAVGKICWQVLQSGQTKRCGFCPIHKLSKNSDLTVIWEEKNTVTGRYYTNTDVFIEWADKRKVHLQHSIDTTDIKIVENSLKKQLQQQELMAAMSQSFISPLNTELLINNALRMAGEFMNVGKIMMSRLNTVTQTLDQHFEWHNEKELSIKSEKTIIPFHEGTVEYDGFMMQKLSYLAFDNILEIEKFAKAINMGINALLCIPLYVSGSFWGMLSFEEYNNTRMWSGSEIQLVKLIGTVISGVLERNITEEKLIRMSSIANSSPQFICYINTDGSFEYFNPGGLKLLGYTAEDFTGKDISVILSEENFQYLKNTIIPFILQNGKENFELPVITKTGETRLLLFSLFRTNFKTAGIGIIARDITDKRQLELDLVKAKEQAERSSRAKSEFLSRMSHEMRTPMNAIIGMTNIAKSSKEAEKKGYCLDKIEDASKHLLGVINDILDMSKIESGKFEITYAEFNFEKMLMRVIDIVNFRINEKNQNLIVNIDTDIPHVIISDEQRLTQVITNLLSNAVKFTPEKGTITLNVHKIYEKDNYYTFQIEVIDTGIGISKKQQENLFRYFEQADGGISRKFGGTGLGLAISKSIIELMDGEIWVESDIAQGARFIFKINVEKGIYLKESISKQDIDWKNIRILVVDDAPEVLEYFISFANSQGIYCDAASSGFEALKIIDKNNNSPFNIIFIDWKMPEMNGIELTKKIKSMFGPNTVIIMISSTEWNEIENEAKAAGVDGFIPKPLFPSLIVNCINDFFSLKKNSTEKKEISSEEKYTGIFKDFKLLLVEDVDVNREIVSALLEETGVKIDYAENGAEAVQIFRDNPSLYNLILMDIHMPEMDGFEATRQIRKLRDHKAKTVPIIAMTANVFKEDIEKCLQTGMNDHISKPIDMEDVFYKLKKYLL